MACTVVVLGIDALMGVDGRGDLAGGGDLLLRGHTSNLFTVALVLRFIWGFFVG